MTLLHGGACVKTACLAQDEFYAKRKDVPWEPYILNNSFAYTAYYQVPGN